MNVEMREVEKIIPYDKNPRKNDAAVDAVARSIQEFGFRQPIVVDASGVIIVGHTRWKAAKKLGLKEVPVHVADLDPVKARAYRIADNKSNEIAEWDEALLAEELTALKDADFDLSAMGFTTEDLDGIFGAQEGLTNVHLNQQYHLLIVCDSELHVQTLYAELSQRGLSCQVLSVM